MRNERKIGRLNSAPFLFRRESAWVLGFAQDSFELEMGIEVVWIGWGDPKWDGAVESHPCAQNAQGWGTRDPSLIGENKVRIDREEGGEEEGEEQEAIGPQRGEQASCESARITGTAYATGCSEDGGDDQCDSEEAVKGHLAQFKYLLEAIGLYPSWGMLTRKVWKAMTLRRLFCRTSSFRTGYGRRSVGSGRSRKGGRRFGK